MSIEKANKIIDEVLENQKKILDLTGLGLTEWPKNIIKLKDIIHDLYLAHNKISEIPDDIGNLTRLTGLSLASNPIRALPDKFWNLIRFVPK